MRILLDECVPRPLRREIKGHDIRTIQEMGWAGKKNGELLALMARSGIEVLLTVDRSIRRQQNLTASGVAVLVMVAVSNRLAELVPLVPGVETALRSIQAGDVLEVHSKPCSQQRNNRGKCAANQASAAECSASSRSRRRSSGGCRTRRPPRTWAGIAAWSISW